MGSIKLSPSEAVAVASRPTDSPWQSRSEYEPHVIIGNVDGGYGDDGTEVRHTNVCEVADNDDAPANTALILAVHDMLTALKDARVYIANIYDECDRHDYAESQRVFRRIDAAIAKAESR